MPGSPWRRSAARIFARNAVDWIAETARTKPFDAARGPEALQAKAVVAKITAKVLDLGSRLPRRLCVRVCLRCHWTDPVGSRCAKKRGWWADEGRAVEIAIAARGE